MNTILLIGVGSGIGGICRYWLSTVTYALIGRDFPYGTLAVNIVGCFLVGLIFVLLLSRFDGMSEQLRALLIIGFLGGFTTFSSFTLESVNLYENGELIRAVLNIGLSVIICLAATWSGIILGRQL